MGGMKGLGPVGVLGLLENPEPAQENKNLIVGRVEVTITKSMCVVKLTSKAPPEVADVCKWVQCVWLD